ncbi:MAG: divalent metal cation transporter, partial [Planctomycetaceae bacterium]|nr:divalent metal cation transporter [Planctomycetaceae bacterium]
MQRSRSLLSIIGPAIVVAAVVLGPGSILTSSKVGCEYGYRMLWVVTMAGLLMVGATALSGRLGSRLERTLCGELAHQLGRPAAAFIGVVLFLVVAAFQSSNNIAVVAAFDPLLPQVSEQWPLEKLNMLKAFILVLSNGLIVATLYGFSQLYGKLEKLMIALMIMMVIGFGVNLLFAKPNLLEVFRGF